MADPITEKVVLDYMTILTEVDAGLRGRHPDEWLNRLESQHTRLGEILDWCLVHNRCDLGLEITGIVWPFWLNRGHLLEGREWFAKLLAISETQSPSIGRARSLAGAGTLVFFQGDIEASAQQLRESLTLCEDLHFAQGIAEAHSGLSRIAMAQGNPDEMRRQSYAALEVARQTDNEAGIAIALHHLAHAALMEGELEQAERLYAENVETYRSMERHDLVVSEFHNLGHVACLRGQTERARSLFIESLRLAEEINNHAIRPYDIMGLGRVAAALKRPEVAAVLLSAGMAMLQAQGKAIVPLLRPEIERAIAETKASLSAEAFEAASARGRELSTSEAIQMANEL
jgi:tetratricopeptide (TPR) repeat protein